MSLDLTTREHGGSLLFDGYEVLAYRSQVPGRLWWFEALAADATLGNPEPVETSLRSMARDGTRTVISRYDNRKPGFQIVVVAVNAVALAAGEKALFLSCQRPVALEWTPPSGLGATTRYQVQTARLDHQFDDLAEMSRGGGLIRRSYRLSMNAAPFGQSTDLVVLNFPAAAAAPVLTPLDTMGSATGWVASASRMDISTGTVDGQTYLQVAWSTESPNDMFIRKAGTSYPCEDFVVVEWSETSGIRPDLLVDGERVSSVASTTIRPGTTSEAVRDFFYVGGGTHTFGFVWTPKLAGYLSPNPSNPGSPYFTTSGSGTHRFYDISTTDDIPQGVARRLRVPGSARGPWSLRASSTTFATSDLGPTLIAVGPKVGTYNPLIKPTGPIDGGLRSYTLPPGSYGVLALFTASAAGETFTVNGRPTRVKTSARTQMLGRVDFGGGRGGRPMRAQVAVGSDGSAPDAALFLIPLDDDHTYVVGDFQRHVFCDPPDLLDRGGVFTGDQPDGADAAPAWATSLITHPLQIAPDESALYVYPLDADVQVSGFPYWHTHAGAINDA